MKKEKTLTREVAVLFLVAILVLAVSYPILESKPEKHLLGSLAFAGVAAGFVCSVVFGATLACMLWYKACYMVAKKIMRRRRWEKKLIICGFIVGIGGINCLYFLLSLPLFCWWNAACLAIAIACFIAGMAPIKVAISNSHLPYQQARLWEGKASEYRPTTPAGGLIE